MAEQLAILGLQRAPYLDPTDARFFYADPILVQRLDLLQHLTQFGDMLLGVSGPAGSGKSTLAQQFLQRSNTAWRTCHVNSAQIQHPDELLTKLAECFGLQSSATPERLKADLLRYCQSLRHNAQLAVIVIDDAQQLPDPALKALLELADNPRETLKQLRVILFSEPGLEQRLIAAGWHSPLHPLLHNLDIPRFDEQQTAAYLMYRLAVAGYSGESPFSLTEIRALHKAADGLPGRLNVLAHETLMERAGRIIANRNRRGSPPSRRVPPILVLGLLGSLIVGGLAWYLSQEPSPHEPLGPQALAPSTLAEPSPKPTDVDAPTRPAETAEPTTKEPGKSLGTTPKTRQLADVNTETTGELTPAPSQPAPATVVTPPVAATAAPPPNTPTANASAPESASAPNAPAMNTPPPATVTTKTDAPPPQAGATPAMETPAAEAKPESVEKPQPAATIAAVASGPPPITPATETAPEPSQPAAMKPTGSPAAASEQASEQLGTEWLQSRPGVHFTLQLLGGRSEKSLREFLQQHRVPEPVATFHTIHKGDDWYVLIHGDFPTMAAAQQAVATLPPAIRRGKPWPRSFASVHDAIRK